MPGRQAGVGASNLNSNSLSPTAHREKNTWTGGCTGEW